MKPAHKVKKAKEMAKTTIKRDREIIVKMMEEWKNSGLISSFKEYKEGQSIVGIQFEMDEVASFKTLKDLVDCVNSK